MWQLADLRFSGLIFFSFGIVICVFVICGFAICGAKLFCGLKLPQVHKYILFLLTAYNALIQIFTK
jgi:hypothetical protein